MEAKIITYETKDLTNTQRSIISKRLFGFKDKTKNSRYIYQRKGLLASYPHLVITKKTFVLASKHTNQIISRLEKLGAKVRVWEIQINKKQLKTYG